MKGFNSVNSIIAGIFIFLLASLSAEDWLSAQTMSVQLHQDSRLGVISEEQRLVYNALAVLRPDLLPEAYRELETRADKCGTFPLFEVKKNWATLNTANRALLEPLLQRPNLPDSLISPSGFFKIHYTTSGGDATTEDYAREAADAFDRAYQVEITELGYPAPPADYGIDGPEYDVYIMQIGNYYGYTQPEQEIPSTPQNDYTTYIAVDNDYSESNFYTKGIDALRVTSAHEFFHAIHFGIREPNWQSTVSQDVFYYEISGVWMEDVVWDEINDYLQDFYLKSFFSYPHLPFYTCNGQREYGQAVWNHFIAKKFGRETIRNTWLYMYEKTALEAIERALADAGVSFEDALAEFAVWNYFTADRADTVTYYEEGHYYPKVKIATSEAFFTRTEFEGEARILSTKYFRFVPTVGDWYSTKLIGDAGQLWRIASILEPSAGDTSVSISSNETAHSIGFVGSADSLLVLCAHVKSPPPFANIPYPPVTYPYTILIEPDTSMEQSSARNSIAGIFPNPFHLTRDISVQISLKIAGEQEVSVTIADSQGRIVKTAQLGRLNEGGANNWLWNGRNMEDELVHSGVYVVIVKFGDTFAREKIALIR